MVVSELEARISAGVALEVSKGSLTKGDECFFRSCFGKQIVVLYIGISFYNRE